MALFRLGYDHPDRQIVYWEKAIDLFRQVDDRSSMASLLCATARFRILLTGDIETAQKDLDEVLSVRARCGVEIPVSVKLATVGPRPVAMGAKVPGSSSPSALTTFGARSTV